MLLAIIGLGMFGFAFALVPFYRLYCQLVGQNTVVIAKKADSLKKTAEKSAREITVEFDVTNNMDNPFIIKPNQRTLHIHPGKMYSTYFTAENESAHDITLQAIPSFTPGISAKYFKKTECFCFRQQHLTAKQKVNMPLIFYVDKQMPKNIKINHINIILYNI